MTGAEILNMCDKIIKRQDLDKELLLSLINQQRRMVFRSFYLQKLLEWRRNLEPEDGEVSVPELKQARYVEWNPDPADNLISSSSSRKKKLFQLPTMQDAYEIYDDVDAVGEPLHFVVLSQKLKIIPAPPVGVINIFGEWYPPDIGDDDNEDVLCKEVSDAITYLGCAEYLDFLEETDKGKIWRSKAESMLTTYKAEIRRQATDDIELLARDPFGNLGIIGGKRRERGQTVPLDELTGGTKGDVYGGGDD